MQLTDEILPEPKGFTRQHGCDDRITSIAELIAIRLLLVTKAISLNRIFDDLKPFWSSPACLNRPIGRELFEDAVEAAIGWGWIERSPLCCTALGTEVGWRFLGFQNEPKVTKQITWAKLRRTYLVAASLDFPPTAKNLQWLSKSYGLFSAILIRHHRLTLDGGNTPATVLDAIAWQQMSLVQRPNLTQKRRFTRNSVLKDVFFENTPCSNLLARLACLATSSANANVDRIRERVICHAFNKRLNARQVSDSDSSPQSCDLASFVELTRRLASESSTANDCNKVFIGTVWDRYRSIHQEVSRSTFDDLLLSAAKHDLLSLCRADLPERFNPIDVKNSEIFHAFGSGKFHFIRT